MGLNHSPLITLTNMSIYLDAANTKSYTGTGTNWRTLVGTNNYTTNAAWNSAGYFTFNGTNADAYSTDAINFPAINTTSFTATGWFRTSTASGKKIFGFENVNSGTGGSGHDKHLYISSGFVGTPNQPVGSLVWGVWTGSTNRIVSSASYIDNAWYNFALSYNATTPLVTLYVNGVSVGSNAVLSTDAPTYLRIASYLMTWNGSSSGYFPGDISNFMFYYGTALTEAQVQQNFNALRGRYGV